MGVCDITRREYNVMPRGEQQALRLKVCTATNIEDGLQLQVRILEYIHINSLDGKPVLLADINRRYSRPAKKLGTRTNDIVGELIQNGTVDMLEWKSLSAVFSSAIYKEIEAVREKHNISMPPLLDILMESISILV